MSRQASNPARTVANKAQQVAAKVRRGNSEGRRSLPIRRSPEDIQAFWNDDVVRKRVLDGLPVREASLEVAGPDRDWGTTTTIRLELTGPVPGMATQTLAGKAVRRLKAVCETNEIPTTAFNPSARSDAGEPAS